MEGDFDVTIVAVGEFVYAEHLLEEGIVVTGDGCTPFMHVGKVAFSFCFTFLSESFFSFTVFFLMTFLPLLQTVMTRLQKHFIDLVGINFDMNGAVRRGSRFTFQNQKSVLDFVKFVYLLIVQSVDIVFIGCVHLLRLKGLCMYWFSCAS